MQKECVGNKELISTCSSFLDKYYNATEVQDKKRYFNILYSLISCNITNSSISDYKDFYNWCNEDVITNKILEDVLSVTLEVKSSEFTLVQSVANIKKEISNLEKIIKCKGVC